MTSALEVVCAALHTFARRGPKVCVREHSRRSRVTYARAVVRRPRPESKEVCMLRRLSVVVCVPRELFEKAACLIVTSSVTTVAGASKGFAR